MKDNNIVIKKVITVLALTTVLMALLFGAALYNHFFNQSENEILNDFNHINPPNDTIPRDPISPPLMD